MSNRIDFYQAQQTKLAIPAGRAEVLIDGQLCPYLEVFKITRSPWPDFSSARLVYNPALNPDESIVSAEEIEAIIQAGKSICIKQIYNGTVPDASAFGLIIFAGHIETIETKIDGNGESVEIIATDASETLKRITVYGQRVVNSDDSNLFLTGLETLFNSDGQANACNNSAQINGKSYTVFGQNASQAKFWTYAEVIQYLLCEYLPGQRLKIPDIEQLKSFTDNQVVYDLDVTGDNVLEALHKCCTMMGIEFKFIPRQDSIGPSQAIVFYRPGKTRNVELNCQSKGENLTISKTAVAELDNKRDFWPVTNKYIGQGDFKIFEATFNLVKAWDPADESTDSSKFSPSTNPDFYQVKNVYRKWTLNEAGDYTGSPYNQGDAFNFSKIFDTKNYAKSRRRFYPTLTMDKMDKSLGYFLEVSLNNGVDWSQYSDAFNNLLDECGIWLSSDQFDTDVWTAALNDTLEFRITASVISDERLSYSIADGPVNSVAQIIEQIITSSGRFKYKKVTSESIFANSSLDSIGTIDEIDDSLALAGFIRQTASDSSNHFETIDIKTPCIAFDFDIGDRIATGPDSRDMLGAKNDNRSLYWIDEVQIDFANQQTELKIKRKRTQL